MSVREWSIEDGFNGAERVPFLVRSDGGDGIRLDAIAAQWLKETMFTAKKAEAAEQRIPRLLGLLRECEKVEPDALGRGLLRRITEEVGK